VAVERFVGTWKKLRRQEGGLRVLWDSWEFNYNHGI